MAGKPGPLPANAGHRRELFHPRRAQRRAAAAPPFAPDAGARPGPSLDGGLARGAGPAASVGYLGRQDGAWPALELVRLSDGGTAFSASVTAALSPARARTGCGRSRCAARASPRGPSPFSPAPWPWCPPPTPGDLSPLLPPCVTWYDRARRRFLDPCACLCERDAAFLTARLTLLCRLNEQPSLRSPLYDPAAGLCGVLGPFLTDISRARGAWARSAFAGRRAGAGRSPHPDSGRPYAGGHARRGPGRNAASAGGRPRRQPASSRGAGPRASRRGGRRLRPLLSGRHGLCPPVRLLPG